MQIGYAVATGLGNVAQGFQEIGPISGVRIILVTRELQIMHRRVGHAQCRIDVCKGDIHNILSIFNAMRLDNLQLVIGLLVITRIITAHHEIEVSQVVDARDILLGIAVILGHRDGLLESFFGLLRVGLPIHDAQILQAICLKLKVVNAPVAVKCLFYLLNVSAVIGMMFEIELTHAKPRIPQVGVIIGLGGFHLSHFIENHGCVGFGQLLHDTTFIYIGTDELFAF